MLLGDKIHINDSTLGEHGTATGRCKRVATQAEGETATKVVCCYKTGFLSEGASHALLLPRSRSIRGDVGAGAWVPRHVRCDLVALLGQVPGQLRIHVREHGIQRRLWLLCSLCQRSHHL